MEEHDYEQGAFSEAERDVRPIDGESGAVIDRYDLALELADGDEQRAATLVHPAHRPVRNVKMRFDDVASGVYGGLSIYFHLEEQEVLDTLVLVHEEELPRTFSPNTVWNAFRTEIETTREEEGYDEARSNELQQKISHILAFSRKDDFARSIEEGDEALFRSVFDDIFFAAFAAKEVPFEFAIEDINFVDFAMTEQNERTETDEENDEEDDVESLLPDANAPEKGTVIEVRPVLAPLNGVIIGRLQADNVIYIRVSDTRPVGKRFLREMERKHQAQNPQIPAIVKGVFYNTEQKVTEVYLALGDGIVGRIEEADPIKVKVKEEEAPETLPLAKNAMKQEPENYFVTFAIVILGIGGIIALIALALNVLGIV